MKTQKVFVLNAALKYTHIHCAKISQPRNSKR